VTGDDARALHRAGRPPDIAMFPRRFLMHTRRAITFALAAVLMVPLGLSLGGCHHWKTPAVSPPIMKDFSPSATITIDESCNASSDPTETWTGALVQFCNNANCLITIVFESDDLFGRDSLRLDPGECVSLRVMSGAADRTFLYDVDCCKGGGNSTPEIKVSSPPPPEP
jgi:hypothetical protein